MKQNNAPPPDVSAVRISNDRLTFELEDGRTINVPLACYPTLTLATPVWFARLRRPTTGHANARRKDAF